MPRKEVFDAKFYVRAYEYARSGESDAAIGKMLGVSPQTIKSWKAAKPAFKDAITRGRKASSGADGAAGFKDYVYKRLPPELQELWNYIEEVDQKDASQIERVEALLSDAGERARQHLYINALVSSNFNNGRALRFVNVSYATLNRWIKNDPHFGEMIEALHQAKKDFFESALCDAVKRGETAAVIFANETANRDRGYSRKVQVVGEVTHQHAHHHDHTHRIVAVQDLNLSLDVQRAILKAIREKEDAIEGEVINDSPAQGRQLLRV